MISTITFPLFAPAVSAQQMGESSRQFEVDRGAGLYASDCAECHSDGSGIPGVNFRTGQFHRAKTDEDLMAVIRDGVPGTAMPPHSDLAPADVVALVAFVRALGRDQGGSLVKLGDEKRGKEIFDNAGGCLNCHRVGAEGSHVALNLTDIGSSRSPSFIQRALLDPASVAKEIPQSRFLRAVTSEGTTIVGRRMNEDTYTVQLIDLHENLVSLRKDQLRSLTSVDGPAMPSLKGKFSDDQISDLMAYLVSLRSLNAPAPDVVFGVGTYQGGGYGAAITGRANAAPTATPRASAPLLPPPNNNGTAPPPAAGGAR